MMLCQVASRLGDYVEVERRYRVAVAAMTGDPDPIVPVKLSALAGLASAQATLGEHSAAVRTAGEAPRIGSPVPAIERRPVASSSAHGRRSESFGFGKLGGHAN